MRCLSILAGLIGCLFFSLNLAAQPSRLELIHADINRGQLSADLEELRVLEGNVHVRQDTVEIFCDRATYYSRQQKLVLEGNVRIHRGPEVLRAQTVTYYENRKLAVSQGNVRVLRPGQEMRSQYLEYYYDTDRAFAKTNLLLIDEDSRTRVSAVEGEYIPRENRSRVEKNAHFWQVANSGNDTLHIYARLMEYFFAPERKAVARDSVRILRGDLTARCDSAVYWLDQERLFLELNPRAQQQNNELFGRQMELDLAGMELHKITVRGQANAISVEDSMRQKVNRLTGQEIIGFIVNRKIDQLWAINNARSRYYLKEQEIEQGFNVASADTIQLFFKEGELQRIRVRGGAQGIFYPVDYKGAIETEY